MKTPQVLQRLATLAVIEALQLKIEAGGGDGTKKEAANPATVPVPASQPCKHTLVKNPSVVHTTERSHHILPYEFFYF